MMLWAPRAALAVTAVLAAGLPAAAQSSATPPYAGLQSRTIKALSDNEIADLTAGRGMGLALPAELNGYPGPAHVLALAQPLGLTDEQRTKVQALFDQMKSEAIPLGQKLIDAEKDLNRRFADHTITLEQLKTATADIAVIRGDLRHTHLKYHLSTATLLSREQSQRYAELRGYAAASHDGASHQPTMQHMLRSPTE
jgi:hypothetical protein